MEKKLKINLIKPLYDKCNIRKKRTLHFINKHFKQQKQTKTIIKAETIQTMLWIKYIMFDINWKWKKETRS